MMVRGRAAAQQLSGSASVQCFHHRQREPKQATDFSSCLGRQAAAWLSSIKRAADCRLSDLARGPLLQAPAEGPEMRRSVS